MPDLCPVHHDQDKGNSQVLKDLQKIRGTKTTDVLFCGTQRRYQGSLFMKCNFLTLSEKKFLKMISMGSLSNVKGLQYSKSGSEAFADY